MRSRSETLAAYLMLAPALAALAIFRIYPIAATVWGSLCTESFVVAGKQIFVGAANYVDLMKDPIFWKTIWVTIKLNLVINPFQVCLAFGLALMVNQNFRGIGFYRLLFFIPIGVSLPIACVVWRIMLDPNSGLIDSLLAALRIPNQPFLISQNQALWCIVAIASWKGVSFWMIFLWAGLQDVPRELQEAAKIDGAGAVQRLLRITLPLLKRPLLFVLVTDTAVNFLLFVPMFLLTGGGPSYSTNVLMYEAYKTGFVYGEMGRALAIVMVMLTLVVATVIIQFQLFRQEQS
ncbi:MAG: sugar ABC transporter permease [Verrucomicrobia bacterium]|nr:sugar ABC transporter permease [Verrucomicrobiota bacterium]MBV9672467.1 sugar ABC transporter permease [Verrucomicrobiota bacterium]